MQRLSHLLMLCEAPCVAFLRLHIMHLESLYIVTLNLSLLSLAELSWPPFHQVHVSRLSDTQPALCRGQVPLTETEPSAPMPELLDAVRRESETDRSVMEKGTRAFVSFVRGYKEHHCKFIFRLAGACGASGSRNRFQTAVACLLPSRCCIPDPWLYIAWGRQRWG